MSEADSKYNRSEKGKARYARHREKTREQRQEYDRERMSVGASGWSKKRKRELGRQRVRIEQRLEALRQEELRAELGAKETPS